ncbi:lipoprotein insertase outer membrane protein LolB [Endozoicomonas arenosclerae]|uniref:lipoprotein insertase outer membrane protein LolB n=1 Tax=Endozoicomonas arenosclerae TaxID=1633495 RepID=UPI0007835D18|nr:lipoprotein insertase outer membrane protein LolB [Endozoicomonas arenosclerae]
MRTSFSRSLPRTFSNNLKLGLLVCFVAFLSGCASTPKPEQALSEQERQARWQFHQQQLAMLDDWNLKGRMGLRVPGQSGSLSLEWQQSTARYRIYLDGPLGQSVAKIEGTEDHVELEASGQKYQGRNPEALLFELTGWDLPVSLLRYWVVGLPSPHSQSNVQLNSQGYPERISQQGWQVEYLQYKDFAGITLPARIKVRQGEVQATLVAKSWQLN